MFSLKKVSTNMCLLCCIEDRNDNAPMFIVPDSVGPVFTTTYSLTLSEKTRTGSTLLSVNATDRDSGLMGQLIYSLQDIPDSRFGIDALTGNLTLAAYDFISQLLFSYLLPSMPGLAYESNNYKFVVACLVRTCFDLNGTSTF